jgi:DNA-binding IclR family transcriptional regulator
MDTETAKRTIDRSSTEEEEARQPVYAAPALEKGLDILELLSRHEEGLTRRDIAEQLGRSVSEIFRMVETLTRRSYLVQREDTFVLGMKMYELAHEFPPMNRLLRQALPRMEALAKSVDQSCHLTVLSGSRQFVVAQVDPPGGMGFSVKIGADIDLLKSSSGHVLLAFRDKAEAARVIDLAGAGLTETERKALMRSIAKVAAQGFAFMKSRQFSGLQAITYPVLDLRGYATAAVTVAYVTRLDEPTRKPTSIVQLELAKVAADLTFSLSGSAAGGAQA